MGYNTSILPKLLLVLKLRYQFVTENEVLDTETKLVWMNDYKDNLSFDEAIKYAEKIAIETGQAWRVPTVDELAGLADRNLCNPASSFPNMPSCLFWSSSPYGGVTDLAWYVSFDYGYVYGSYRDLSYAVRLVRGG